MCLAWWPWRTTSLTTGPCSGTHYSLQARPPWTTKIASQIDWLMGIGFRLIDGLGLVKYLYKKCAVKLFLSLSELRLRIILVYVNLQFGQNKVDPKTDPNQQILCSGYKLCCGWARRDLDSDLLSSTVYLFETSCFLIEDIFINCEKKIPVCIACCFPLMVQHCLLVVFLSFRDTIDQMLDLPPGSYHPISYEQVDKEWGGQISFELSPSEEKASIEILFIITML